MNDSIDPIVRELNFTTPIEQVWQAITDPQAVAQWFGSSAEFELIEGSLGYFAWQQECEGKFAMRIETISPPRYFVWRWMAKQDVPFDPSSSTLVQWQLSSTEAKGTKLVLTESGFIQAKQRKMNEQGWTEELDDLTRYLQIDN